MGVLSFLLELLQGGLANLAAYLAAHVLLCLLPAFFIAGAMTALIPKESVTRFLALIFRREDADHDRLTDETFAGSGHLRLPVLVFLLVLVALLLAGTLKIS